MRLIDSPLLATLGPEQQRLLQAECRRRSFRRGDTIFHAEDPANALHIVSRGVVAISSHDGAGRPATLGYRTVGEVFGVLSLVHEQANDTRMATARAVTEAETLVLTSDRFRELCRQHPELNAFLVGALAARIHYLEDRLSEALLLPADARVVRRLAALVDRMDLSQKGAVEITQDDLASLAGTTRPTVNKVLRTAERLGFVTLGRGRIVVIDRDGLLRHFNLDSPIGGPDR